MKKPILISSAAFALLLLALGIFLFRRGRRSRIPDGPGTSGEQDIRSVTYFHGGSSIGDVYRIDLSGDCFTVTKQPAHGQPETKRSHAAGADLYSELDALIERYSVRDWIDLPEAQYHEDDGAGTSLDIWFRDGTRIHASSEMELPEDGYTAIRAIREAFEARMD